MLHFWRECYLHFDTEFFRLQDYDFLALHTTRNGVVKDGKYEFPAQDFLKDRELNASRTLKVSTTCVVDYIQSVEKANNTKVDVARGERMYRERFLKSNLRHFQDKNGSIYLKGRVKSEFSKSLIYNVDIKFANKMFTDVVCECKAGLGPAAYCKHVVVVLKGIEEFLKTGAVTCEKVCTENLQTFHQAKKYNFSPVKTRLLKLSRPLTRVRQVRDPRPVNLIPKKGKFIHNKVTVKQGKLVSKSKGGNYYSIQEKFSRFRNTCINFAAEFLQIFPELQLFKAANILAVDKDHDYCKDSLCQSFLKAVGILEITEEKVKDIECLTREQSESKYWQHDRGLRLNSSSWGKIIEVCGKYWNMNNNEFMSDAELKKLKEEEHNAKKKLTQELLYPQDLSNLPAVKHGRKYEIHAVRKFEELCNKTTTSCGSFISLKKPFLASSPDRLLLEKFCVEVKNPYSAFNKAITPENVPYLKINENGTLVLNLDNPVGRAYFTQCQGQLYCTDREVCFFVVYTVVDCYVIEIEREDIFLDNVVDMLEEYYNDYYLEAMLNKYLYRN